jgi:hydrogenase maturation factor
MCLGSIQMIDDLWEDERGRSGRLRDGKIVSLAFVPEAEAGDYVIVHLGIPVEVLSAEDALAALDLRTGAAR